MSLNDASNIVAEIEQKIAAFEAERKDLTEKLSQNFKHLFTAFFEAHPTVKKIGWTQYTPYFNDGDTCEFSRNDFAIKIKSDQDDENEDWLYDTPSLDRNDDTKLSEWTEKYVPGATVAIVKDFVNLTKALEKIDDSFYLSLFGDHSKVIVDREGVTVEEYDHD